VLKFFSAMCVLLVILKLAVSAESKFLPQKLLDDGWISLFDGESLFGWTPTGDAKWDVVDGEVRTIGDRSGFLMTTSEWADYELHVEFKAEPKTNSGVFLRTPLKPTSPAKDCYELNIAPADNPFPTGSFVARQQCDSIAADGKWHGFDVTANGGKFVVRCDGKVVLDYADASPVPIGHIGLQSREGAVAFRNVRLRPLGLRPLLNGRDLKDWVQERVEKSRFEVTKNGELHLSNGPGQIETEKDFANFVLQLECKVNGDGLNSGVFFRTLRNGRWAGYESQINNRVKENDPTKPADFGTGAIYRRQPARRVVPNDREWFAKTIVADGSHMAVWVNGYQVSDWTDKRPAKENAREGLRLAGGAIAIQGHDATTDFLFRKIEVAELPR
jgi:3-keto-disaccharide hydrolase